MNEKKAIIISIKSTELNKNEQKLLKKKTLGIILFKRNIKSLNQIKKLIKDIRKFTKDKKFPVLIDEEGKTVTRLNGIIKNNFTQKFFGDLYKFKPKEAIKFYEIYIDNICKVLNNIGINLNTVPVLDVLTKKTHKIIGKRSFSNDPKIVKKLGEICVNRYKKNKIGTVVKHIPGHGSASSDSHFFTPRVKLGSKILLKNDFFPFVKNKSLFAMTAHVIYKSFDRHNVATFSNKVISKIIRRKINYKGIIISDDISMKALKYNLITNAKKSLTAGCNLVLYCKGNYAESSKLIKLLPYIDKFTQKTSEFYKFLS